MDNAMNWRVEQASDLAIGSVTRFESSLDNERLNALRNLVLLLLREIESIQLERPGSADESAGLQDQVQRFESDLIRQALYRTRGNQAQAARLLGVKHTTLNAKIHRHGISLIDQAEESEKVVREHVIAA